MAHDKDFSESEKKRRREDAKKPRSVQKTERKAKKKKRRARQDTEALEADAQLAIDKSDKKIRKDNIATRQKELIAEKRAGADVNINETIRNEFGAGRSADSGALPNLVDGTQVPQANSGAGVGPENLANQTAPLGSVPSAAEQRTPQPASEFNITTHDVRSVPGFENLTPQQQEQMIATQRQVLGGPISEAGLIGSVPGEPITAPAKLNVPGDFQPSGPGATPSIPGETALGGGFQQPTAPTQATPQPLDPDERGTGFPPPTEPISPTSGLSEVLGDVLANRDLPQDVIEGVTGLLTGIAQIEGQQPSDAFFNSDLGIYEALGPLDEVGQQWVADANRAIIGASIGERIALELLSQTGTIDQIKLRQEFDREMLELQDASQLDLLERRFQNDLEIRALNEAAQAGLQQTGFDNDLNVAAVRHGYDKELQQLSRDDRLAFETAVNEGRIDLAKIQSSLDFKNTVQTLNAEIGAQLKLDEALEEQQIIDVPQGGAFTAADGSFDQQAADRARTDFIPKMRAFIDRARKSGDILQLEEGISLLRQQFPLPPEIVWDGKSFSNRAGLEGRNRTPEVEEYLRLAQDAYTQMTTARNAITAQLDINDRLKLQSGLAAIEDQKLRKALETNDIDTAEEAEIRLTQAQAQQTQLETALMPLQMLLNLTANPVQLAMAKRFGILDQIAGVFSEAGIDFDMPDFFSNMNIETGSVPSVDNFTRMSEAERTAIMAEWIAENGGTPDDFFKAFQGNLPSSVRGSTQVTSF